MIYGYSVWCNTLQRHWEKPFSQKTWDKLTSIVDIHKLTYRIDDAIKKDKGNYYNWVLKEFNLSRERVNCAVLFIIYVYIFPY